MEILPRQVQFITSLNSFPNLDSFDGVINLAGEPIFAKPWNTERKRTLFNSRISLTNQISQLINLGKKPPHFFISGSATGYYGEQGERLINETCPPANHFAAQLCQQWEMAALTAKTRVCLLRTGIVLSKEGGALEKMLPLYRTGLSGKLGNGKQFWGWIALEDMLNGILFLIQNAQCQGAFNFVAPQAIRNQEFNQLLSQVLKRPACLTTPKFLLKLVLGERANLLLDSQNLVPEKLLQQGFQFQQAELRSFLQQELQS